MRLLACDAISDDANCKSVSFDFSVERDGVVEGGALITKHQFLISYFMDIKFCNLCY